MAISIPPGILVDSHSHPESEMELTLGFEEAELLIPTLSLIGECGGAENTG